MKIAISGKGGVGKSTISSLVTHYFADRDKTVLAVDADPDANLAHALGINFKDAESIEPISRKRKLIEERTGAKVRQFGQMFILNPKVSDIVDEYCYRQGNINLLVMGGTDKGGGGCACPENVLLRSLISDIILSRNEIVVIDMEAGVEHIGRGTASSVDFFLVVVEPVKMTLESADRIISLAAEIGVENPLVVGNKIIDDSDREFIENHFKDREVLGFLPADNKIRSAERNNLNPYEFASEELKSALTEILRKLGTGSE